MRILEGGSSLLTNYFKGNEPSVDRRAVTHFWGGPVFALKLTSKDLVVQ